MEIFLSCADRFRGCYSAWNICSDALRYCRCSPFDICYQLHLMLFLLPGYCKETGRA